MKAILILVIMGMTVMGYTQPASEVATHHFLTEAEALKLNSLFEKKRKRFDFNGKNVGFSKGTSGTQLEEKTLFFVKYIDPVIEGAKKNPCTLILFTEDEKKKSGGFDAVIMAPPKLFTKKHRRMLIDNLAKTTTSVLTKNDMHMKEEIKKTIQKYLESYFTNDYATLLTLLDEAETENYVKYFVEFAEKMDQFGETDGFLDKIGVESLEQLNRLSTEEFMNKILALTKHRMGEEEMNKIVRAIEITNIDVADKVATVNYSYPIMLFGEEDVMESKMKLTNQNGHWKIHYQSRLDVVLKSFQNEIDVFHERKSKDQLQNLTHHVNDLEKVTLVGYKNMNGDIVFQPRFKEGGDFSDGFAYVKVMSKYGYIDKSGEIVIKPQFDSARNFSEGMAGVQLSNSDKWAFINKKGEVVIQPMFDEVSEFGEGLCAVEMNDKWGYINKKGEIVIKCQYDEASDFWSDETDVVRLDENGEPQTIYINQKGEIVDEEE